MSADGIEPPPEEPQEFLPTWDVPAAPPAIAETARGLCPLCQAPRDAGQSFCFDCGFVFPAQTGTAVISPVPPPRVKDRYEIGSLLSERDGIAHYQGHDTVTGNPVVVVRAPHVPSPPASGGEGQGEGGQDASGKQVVFAQMPPPSPPPLSPEAGERGDLIPAESGRTEPALKPAWPSVSWEKQVLEQAQHPSLPAILAHFNEPGWEYLIEERATGQCLWDAWDEPAATNELRYFWLKQIAEALQQLHQAGAMPEAIRPEMVQVTLAGQARLSGMADLLPLPLPPRTPVRGSAYTAPELVLGNDHADARANLYSFGGMLYALLIGRELTDTDFEREGVPKPFLAVFPDSHPLVGRLMSKTFCRDVAQRFPSDEAAHSDPSGFAELVRTLDVCRRTLDRVRLEIAAWTTTGIVRSGNEDAFYVLHATEGREDDCDDSALVLLADGMGGAEAGEVAAALAVRTLRGFLMRKKTLAAMTGRVRASVFDRQTCERIIAAALRRANSRVVALSMQRTGRPGNAGCTAEVIFVRGRDLVVGHVGDSRTYLYQDGRLLQVTRDHTMVNRLVDLGVLTPEEAEKHPERNDLIQALGGRRELDPALYHHTLKAGAWILVCSDGLINHLSPDDLQHIFERAAASAESAARRLVNYANLRGGVDNTTVVVIRAC